MSVLINSEPITVSINSETINVEVVSEPINIEVSGARGPAGESASLETYREYVGHCSDPNLGPLVVTPLNSASPVYLGDIEWSLLDVTAMEGTTESDKFTIYTFLVENQCTTSEVPLKVNRGDVVSARKIQLSFTGGLGTIGGLFKIVVYPGDYAPSEI